MFQARRTSLISKTAACALLLTLLASCENTTKTLPVKDCTPTPYDEIGPFYRPDAPMRNKVGSGYLLSGHVLSTSECTPLPEAKLEFWLVNENVEYDDAHRATVIADSKGRYTFESNKPMDYVGRLPHIHMRITAKGHEELITQHYPQKDAVRAEFDIVLPPEAK